MTRQTEVKTKFNRNQFNSRYLEEKEISPDAYPKVDLNRFGAFVYEENFSC